MSRITNRRRLPLLALALLLALTPALAFAYDWTQFNGDSVKRGNNTLETIITPANVNQLQQRFQVTLPDIADGSAPVFLEAASTISGTRNVLFLTVSSDATHRSQLIALDATSGQTIWAAPFQTGPRYTTSQPAVDPNRQHVYSYGVDGKVHKYNIFNGMEITTTGTISNSWPQVATLKPNVEKGAPALAIHTEAGTPYLYAANGGYPGDAGDYQGHLTTINLNTNEQVVFNANCSNLTIHFIENGTPGVNDCAGKQTAIWARPGVVYSPGTGKIYMTTGNGPFTPGNSNYNWADTVFELNPDGTGANGKPLDTHTPTNYAFLNSADLDLGSTAPVILYTPAGSAIPNLAAQAGKEGKISLLNLDNLSGQGGVGFVGGELQKINVPHSTSAVLTQPAAWLNPANGDSWMFITSGGGMSGIKVVVTGTVPALAPQWTRTTGGFTPIVANNIIFYARTGNIYGINPTSGAQLWSATGIGTIHWQSPLVVNGTVYITDGSANSGGTSRLTAFTLNGQPAATPTPGGGATNTPAPPTATSAPPTATNVPPSNTPVPPSATAVPPSNTPVPPSATPLPPSSTPVPPSNTPVPPSNTPQPTQTPGGATATPVPPSPTRTNTPIPPSVTNTSVPPTATSVPPSATSQPQATATNTPLPAGSPTPCTRSFSDVPSNYIFYNEITFIACRGVTNGYPDGTYRPNNNTSRGEIAKLVVLAFGIPTANPPLQSFTDVPPTHPFYQYIEGLAPRGVIVGFPDGSFHPNDPVRRGELAKIVIKAAGIDDPVTPPAPTFSDVPTSNIFYQFIETAYANGFINGAACGGGLCYRPNDNIRRGEMAKVLQRAMTAPLR